MDKIELEKINNEVLAIIDDNILIDEEVKNLREQIFRLISDRCDDLSSAIDNDVLERSILGEDCGSEISNKLLDIFYDKIIKEE